METRSEFAHRKFSETVNLCQLTLLFLSLSPYIVHYTPGNNTVLPMTIKCLLIFYATFWGRIHKEILSLRQKIVSALRFGLS